ncbi:PREDICTED: interferon-induced protein with tetratricopeptide repeats 1-like isoform X2 [Cyprinodon variegatus]|uniref:interferon-induced protein with tetratricopeptide repeats 1-like isoform X2 n=1 Tax=Cyprinodon variegatus TaxID=28743 RepID=UPI000742B94E|nr:PREDICTED: interferon-induced protein with tetratricopeptide repeats 1-like isoform X2 [Cyprinodon variegatus]
MSSKLSLESRLKALQCHFTWDLEVNPPNLNLWDELKDTSREKENVWLGHIYNLQGFIQFKLGSSEEALKFFSQATETFQHLKNSDEGPWLMVNFGNLAWLHHHMGEDEKCQDYLSKCEALMRKYPAPPEEELHPEVCAEKAWTLMRFDKEKKLQAAELFQRAVRMQPDNVEWQTSWAILSAGPFKAYMEDMTPDVLEIVKSASERDPDNLYVAALYLEARAAKGEQIQDEAKDLAEKILEKPMHDYCGIGRVMKLYRKYISVDEAIKIADDALERHPDSRFVKRSAAKCYTKKVFSQRGNPDPRATDKAIRLWREVIEVYPKYSLKEKISRADVQTKVDIEKADQIYRELLDREDLDPAEKQMLYCRYAKHLQFIKKDYRSSTTYHMMAAEIQKESKYKEKSVKQLKKTLKINKDPEIQRRIRELL